jgi:NDP-sugar pyrophosphorylase family protein
MPTNQSQNSLRLGILGAGLGSRMKSAAHTKPLAKIDGKTLLEHLILKFQATGISDIQVALREELLSPGDIAALPRLPGLEYLFVNTESSLHTLGALIAAMGKDRGPILFSMADTVVQQGDLQGFVDHCRQLKASENAILATSHVDDESPLWVHTDPQNKAWKFGGEASGFVTSGMYFLQPQAMEMAEILIESGTQKMRNFLGHLASQGIAIKSFVVAKTIDVDHPSDLKKAAEFLRS